MCDPSPDPSPTPSPDRPPDRSPDPSPDEIRRACERIRATWDEETYQKRGSHKAVQFNWPRISEQELIEAIEEEERDEMGDG